MRTNRPTTASRPLLGRLRAFARPGQRWFPLTLFVAALAIGLLIGWIWTARHAPQAAATAENAATPAAPTSTPRAALPAPMPGDLAALRTPAASAAGGAHIVEPPAAPVEPAPVESAPATAVPVQATAMPAPSQTPPQLLERIAPSYPAEALRNQTQGSVLLRIAVAADGSVADVQVLESSHSRVLDRAAMDAVRNWKFRPATQDGQPVASTMDVPVDFRLGDH